MARAGFDWLCMDLQHTFMDLTTAMCNLQAAAITGVPTFVRTASHEPAELMHMLDAGATGVIPPMVNTAEQAEAIVQACRYAPQGWRSWGPIRAALPFDPYTTGQANRDVQVCVMVETQQADQNNDEILEVEGLDMIFVGPNDLAICLGDEPRHGIASAQHGKLIAEIASKCLARDVTPAIQGGDVRGSRQFIELGYRAVFIATDLALVQDGAQSALAQIASSVKAS
jgi:4-hydroxy-2-oxoheptanedioate aldolase